MQNSLKDADLLRVPMHLQIGKWPLHTDFGISELNCVHGSDTTVKVICLNNRRATQISMDVFLTDCCG